MLRPSPPSFRRGKKKPEKVAARSPRGALRQTAGDLKTGGRLGRGSRGQRGQQRGAGRDQIEQEPWPTCWEGSRPEPPFGRFLFFLVGEQSEEKKGRKKFYAAVEDRALRVPRSRAASKFRGRKESQEKGGSGEVGDSRWSARVGGHECPRGSGEPGGGLLPAWEIRSARALPCVLQDRLFRLCKDRSE